MTEMTDYFKKDSKDSLTFASNGSFDQFLHTTARNSKYPYIKIDKSNKIHS